MTRRDINEENIVRQGLASAASQDGAVSGQVASVTDGELEFVDAGGGSLPAEWTVDSNGNLIIEPERGTTLGLRRLIVKFIDPGEYAHVDLTGATGSLLARALTIGTAGNALVLVLAIDDLNPPSVSVVGSTITATFHSGSTFADVVALLEAEPTATALAAFSTDAPTDPADTPGSYSFENGRAAGAYAGFRGDNSSWYVHTDGGLDIETADGQFIAQFYKDGNDIRAAKPGGRALTLFDNDFNEKMAVDASGVGFNGQATSRPVIAAIPDAQAVVDALVTLGLVTQAA